MNDITDLLVSDNEYADEVNSDVEMPDLDSDSGSEMPVLREVLKPEKKLSTGSFAGMGLSKLVLSNVQRRGYKNPTPIQRKAIPPILEGQDVVGMARTGSGKTAAFVIPMIDALKSHSPIVGARALILSPSRELAMQTLRTVKDFAKKTDLRTVMLIGGDSLEDQFGFMMNNPDIVIATPGRFLHLKVEMQLDLSTIEYVVFDEADRLFEMGFAEQLNQILLALPETRQTLLFSATLPTNIVEFARAGLRNPLLVRLDAEQKISDQLEMAYFSIKDEERDAALAYILQDIIKMPGMDEKQAAYLKKRGEYEEGGQIERREKLGSANDLPSEKSTIVFVPTKHHVEYVTELLKSLGYSVSHIYGSLDQSARREQLYLFQAGKTNIMVVTDVAARGIDIPLLANVINYNVPASPRIFIHRVGRTARAGHRGWAYTIVRQSDLPYMCDLEVLLGRKIATKSTDYNGQLVLGGIPRLTLETYMEQVQGIRDRLYDIEELRKVAGRGEKLYIRSREAASRPALKRSRDLLESGEFDEINTLAAAEDAKQPKASSLSTQQDKDNFLAMLGNRRHKETVFEFKKTGTGSGAEMMAKIRAQVAPVQARAAKKKEEKAAERSAAAAMHESDEELGDAETKYQDKQFFMSHQEPNQTLADRGYSLHGAAGFNDAVKDVTFNLNEEGKDFTQKQRVTWDKKKGKYINSAGADNKKYIRGEDGRKIPASFRSGRFDAWKSAHKTEGQRVGAMEQQGGEQTFDTHNKFLHRKDKAPKPADKYRDDFKKRNEKVQNALSRGLKVKGHQAKNPAGLNSTRSIQKDRDSKRKRVEKSNHKPKRGGSKKR